MRIAYDMKLKKPGSVRLQRELGGNVPLTMFERHFFGIHCTDVVTEDMRVYEVRTWQITILSLLTESGHVPTKLTPEQKRNEAEFFNSFAEEFIAEHVEALLSGEPLPGPPMPTFEVADKEADRVMKEKTETELRGLLNHRINYFNDPF